MHVKMVASLGPSAQSPELVERMASLGVRGFRINFAHGGPRLWDRLVENVRSAEEKIGKPLALIGDLVGPSIRVGVLEEPVVLNPGGKARFVYAEKAEGGREAVIPLPIRRFFEALEEGDILVMDDGRVRLRVTEVSGSEVVVEALTPARISSRKAVVVLGKDLGLPAITMKDLHDIEYAIARGFDYISLSYVREPDDMRVLRDIVRRKGGGQALAAKIENRSAVENLPGIVEEADLVIVARGDLGMNYGLEEIPALQERIVEETRRRGKPVVVATQILESMINSPAPTRAEVTDVYVAVAQGVDAVMLTGETAIGRYPLEAVRWLRRIIRRAEASARIPRYKPMDGRWAYAHSAVEAAEALGAKMLLAYSVNGTLPPKLAASRPLPPVAVGTASERIARRLATLWGLEPIYIGASGYEEGLERLEKLLCSTGGLSIGDLVVETYRVGEESRVAIKRMMNCGST